MDYLKALLPPAKGVLPYYMLAVSTELRKSLSLLGGINRAREQAGELTTHTNPP